ncbi:hypothetical protein NMG60_11017357 [Bertholletia excelsa]
MSRLGLKVEMGDSPSTSDGGSRKKDKCKTRKRRKLENSGSDCTIPRKVHRGDDVRSHLLIDNEMKEKPDLSIPQDAMKLFITTWKEACQVNNVDKVFERMSQFYKISAKQREKMKSMFSSYPCIGLLNVAIESIKCGMWDSMYDTLQAFAEHGISNTRSEKCDEFETIEVEAAVKDSPITAEHVSECVTVNDIVKKISAYFEPEYDVLLSNIKSPLEKKFKLLRKLRSCEFWLNEQFFVKQFESLGYGEFFMFLENHASLLPDALQNCLAGDTTEKCPLEACMLQRQLAVLLSQVSNGLGENENITKETISILLMRQFPPVSFMLVESGSLKDFVNTVRENERTSSCLLFSVTLLGSCLGDSTNENELSKTTGVETNIDSKAGKFGTSTTGDATELLLKAPMLSDLNSWTHWDLVFAPTLGPIVGWLLNEVSTKELLCLLTKDGRIVRIDHTATIDSFLEAALRGSSFQTAVNLLSLLSLYGGEKHVPLSLLKCHARQAFDIFMNSSTETDVNESQALLMQGGSSYKQEVPYEDIYRSSDALHKCQSTVPKAVTVASRFVIDCLSHLPAEFRAFAADVLLSGLNSVIQDAPSAIIGECRQIDQRLMLHDVGLSLGVVEWIDDYHSFCSSMADDASRSSGVSCLQLFSSEFSRGPKDMLDEISKFPSLESKVLISTDVVQQHNKGCSAVSFTHNNESGDVSVDHCERHLSEVDEESEAALVIESIRREEFGLDPGLSEMESSMLRKQHARLGRALHCLSQELYSQDSHFLLELVQNADDNLYAENVEPTLNFILCESGIVVLNNEQGFSAQNIRALCDVGNSTKKGLNTGYIGKKGIGFKSVFRVTDAPEIHSNGFHVKFDVREGEIGFVLPTTVPPCDLDIFRRLASCDSDKTDSYIWNTCIILPFRSRLLEGSTMDSIKLMFSDLHPSLLLFLHRLQCIRYRNLLDDSLIIMRKEILGNGIVNVSLGKEKMTWFVASQVLQVGAIRTDVQTTEISVAFTLQESESGEYIPHLEQQPVFAFLPLRRYGLKFIIQGDFVLPSSREEVDGDSPWNQWLLSRFPDLFVGAERSFCTLPCFRENPGKAITAFMSFVPLVGEVHGFFSSLPRLIISKLRMSRCLLVEGDNKEWVLPCKAIRNWDEQARSLLPDGLLRKHLGLGFLDENIVLSDSLARDLGIEEYGPRILLQVISSLCQLENALKSVGLIWLSSWLNALYTMVFNSSGQIYLNSGTASDVINNLKKIPFIPLSDSTYSSIDDGTIWLHSDGPTPGFSNDHSLDAFPKLYARLRMVSPALLSAAATVHISCLDVSILENVTRMLQRVGIQHLSAHEIVKLHILPAFSDDGILLEDNSLMIEYISFVMFHLQSSCPSCCSERAYIISELHNKAFILTNNGYIKPADCLIHFSKEFGNAIDVNKLIDGMHLKWHEVDPAYLKHPITGSLPGGLMRWREFFQEIGVTDFVHVLSVEKNISDASDVALKNMLTDGGLIFHGAVAKDWESPELDHLLSRLSSRGDRIRCEYLLEVLDTLWDESFSEKVSGQCISGSSGQSRMFRSSFIRSLCGVQWMISSMDHELHYSKDLYYDCEAVRSILGCMAPYAVPKVKSEKLLRDIGFKTEVSLGDVLALLQVWRKSETPLIASIAQMSRFYTFMWNEMTTSKQKIFDELQLGPFIFIPYSCGSKHEDVVPGRLFSPDEVYWHDFTGSTTKIKEMHHRKGSSVSNHPLGKTLCNIYPSLHDFFVNECGVSEVPRLCSYLQILLHLSTVSLPSQAAHTVFQVFVHWSDGLKSGLLSSEDVVYLKENLLKVEYTVLPTVLDKWVSLHSSFGLVCWCDDDKLRKEFKPLDNIDFLYFGELTDNEQEVLQSKVYVLMKTLGIPALSEVVSREAIYYGLEDYSFKASLLNWVLPYAQRYMYSVHPNRYFQLKQSGFENLSSVQIIVVEKLFYRNIIKRSGIASNKRFECSCLLQGNVLYARQESDSHSLFMELSRLLFDGTPDLHLANFLHMVTTMVESGSNEEQTEFFILNSQKVPKLPDNELVWSLLVMPASKENDETPQGGCASAMINEQNHAKQKRKPGISSCWPPVDWKTAPGFNLAHGSGLMVQREVTPPNSSMQVRKEVDSKDEIAQADYEVPLEINAVGAIEVHSPATMTLVLPESKVSEDQYNLLDSGDLPSRSNGPSFGSFKLSERDQLSFGTPNGQQALLTGRLGEFVAFNYYATNFGSNIVTWVNKNNETGLPYDLIVGDNEKSREYIEVKATKSARKDWFTISVREWQFAVDKGEHFSIARVILSGNNTAGITVFKNPVKLCQLGKLQLAVLMPKQQQEFSNTS